MGQPWKQRIQVTLGHAAAETEMERRRQADAGHVMDVEGTRTTERCQD